MTMLVRNFMRTFVKNTRVPVTRRPVDQIVCMDIECTCDSPVQIYPMEVIEIACVKLDFTNVGRDRKIIKKDNAEFHRYVKPVHNPELTLFCQELTGILQTTVDKADRIENIMKDLFNWLKKVDLVDDNLEKKAEFSFATCGNFDLNTLNKVSRYSSSSDKLDKPHNDCSEHNDLPIYFKEWINVKKTFVNHKREWPKGLYNMLVLLGKEPSGRLHSAKDDCKNLALVIERLYQDGCVFYTTDRLRKNDIESNPKKGKNNQLSLSDL